MCSILNCIWFLRLAYNLLQILTIKLGDLERLRRFWLTGTCNPYKEEKKASEPLAPDQFLALFLLLFFGIFIAIGLMGMEHGYMKWMRGTVNKARDTPGCLAMISLVRTLFNKLFASITHYL